MEEKQKKRRKKGRKIEKKFAFTSKKNFMKKQNGEKWREKMAEKLEKFHINSREFFFFETRKMPQKIKEIFLKCWRIKLLGKRQRKIEKISD